MSTIDYIIRSGPRKIGDTNTITLQSETGGTSTPLLVTLGLSSDQFWYKYSEIKDIDIDPSSAELTVTSVFSGNEINSTFKNNMSLPSIVDTEILSISIYPVFDSVDGAKDVTHIEIQWKPGDRIQYAAKANVPTFARGIKFQDGNDTKQSVDYNHVDNMWELSLDRINTTENIIFDYLNVLNADDSDNTYNLTKLLAPTQATLDDVSGALYSDLNPMENAYYKLTNDGAKSTGLFNKQEHYNSTTALAYKWQKDTSKATRISFNSFDKNSDGDFVLDEHNYAQINGQPVELMWFVNEGENITLKFDTGVGITDNIMFLYNRGTHSYPSNTDGAYYGLPSDRANGFEWESDWIPALGDYDLVIKVTKGANGVNPTSAANAHADLNLILRMKLKITSLNNITLFRDHSSYTDNSITKPAGVDHISYPIQLNYDTNISTTTASQLTSIISDSKNANSQRSMIFHKTNKDKGVLKKIAPSTHNKLQYYSAQSYYLRKNDTNTILTLSTTNQLDALANFNELPTASVDQPIVLMGPGGGVQLASITAISQDSTSVTFTTEENGNISCTIESGKIKVSYNSFPRGEKAFDSHDDEVEIAEMHYAHNQSIEMIAHDDQALHYGIESYMAEKLAPSQVGTSVTPSGGVLRNTSELIVNDNTTNSVASLTGGPQNPHGKIYTNNSTLIGEVTNITGGNTGTITTTAGDLSYTTDGGYVRVTYNDVEYYIVENGNADYGYEYTLTEKHHHDGIVLSGAFKDSADNNVSLVTFAYSSVKRKLIGRSDLALVFLKVEDIKIGAMYSEDDSTVEENFPTTVSESFKLSDVYIDQSNVADEDYVIPLRNFQEDATNLTTVDGDVLVIDSNAAMNSTNDGTSTFYFNSESHNAIGTIESIEISGTYETATWNGGDNPQYTVTGNACNLFTNSDTFDSVMIQSGTEYVLKLRLNVGDNNTYSTDNVIGDIHSATYDIINSIGTVLATIPYNDAITDSIGGGNPSDLGFTVQDPVSQYSNTVEFKYAKFVDALTDSVDAFGEDDKLIPCFVNHKRTTQSYIRLAVGEGSVANLVTNVNNGVVATTYNLNQLEMSAVEYEIYDNDQISKLHKDVTHLSVKATLIAPTDCITHVGTKAVSLVNNEVSVKYNIPSTDALFNKLAHKSHMEQYVGSIVDINEISDLPATNNEWTNVFSLHFDQNHINVYNRMEGIAYGDMLNDRFINDSSPYEVDTEALPSPIPGASSVLIKKEHLSATFNLVVRNNPASNSDYNNNRVADITIYNIYKPEYININDYTLALERAAETTIDIDAQPRVPLSTAYPEIVTMLTTITNRVLGSSGLGSNLDTKITNAASAETRVNDLIDDLIAQTSGVGGDTSIMGTYADYREGGHESRLSKLLHITHDIQSVVDENMTVNKIHTEYYNRYNSSVWQLYYLDQLYSLERGIMYNDSVDGILHPSMKSSWPKQSGDWKVLMDNIDTKIDELTTYTNTQINIKQNELNTGNSGDLIALTNVKLEAKYLSEFLRSETIKMFNDIQNFAVYMNEVDQFINIVNQSLTQARQS